MKIKNQESKLKEKGDEEKLKRRLSGGKSKVKDEQAIFKEKLGNKDQKVWSKRYLLPTGGTI